MAWEAIVIIGASCVIVGKIVHQLNKKEISKRRYKDSVKIKKRKKRRRSDTPPRKQKKLKK
tara:strand:- start:1809 stop:1991 length:183 start_codon:yes stop_codon:yes gene_type:complete